MLAADSPLDRTLLATQASAQTQEWSARFGTDRHWVLEVDAELAGRLWVGSNELDEVDTVVDLRLLPAYRGRGIGRHLMEYVVSTARGANRAVALTVERANVRAYRMYCELGFRETGGDELRATMRLDAPGNLDALRELVWSRPELEDRLYACESAVSFSSVATRIAGEHGIAVTARGLEEALAAGRAEARGRWVE